jgi:hypothetical protein
MVVIGLLSLIMSAYSFWITGKLETRWLRAFMTVCCGFIFASALLWVGSGFERGEIIFNHSIKLPVWLLDKTQ